MEEKWVICPVCKNKTINTARFLCSEPNITDNIQCSDFRDIFPFLYCITASVMLLYNQ